MTETTCMPREQWHAMAAQWPHNARVPARHQGRDLHTIAQRATYLTHRLVAYEQVCRTDRCRAHPCTGNHGVVKGHLQIRSQRCHAQQ